TVHTLHTGHEDQVGPETGDLLEILRDRIHAAEERVPRREVREDLARGEHRRLERLGQPHGLDSGALTPDVVAEHQDRALRLAELSRDLLDRPGPRRPR